MIEWLSAPISGAAVHSIATWASWHARLMVLGWGVLLPLGALTARYFKIAPWQRWPQQLDSRLWWRAHLLLQWCGLLLVSAGTLLAYENVGGGGLARLVSAGLVDPGLGDPSSVGPAGLVLAHELGGWLLLGLGWMQVVGGLLRGSKGGPTEAQLRGDHYDMTPRRVRFERQHKAIGWLALLGAVAVMALGLRLVDAPRWVPLALAAWWLLLAALAWHWQRSGRCVDTYQAIWGADSCHPGNRVEPIGLGVRRARPGRK